MDVTSNNLFYNSFTDKLYEKVMEILAHVRKMANRSSVLTFFNIEELTQDFRNLICEENLKNEFKFNWNVHSQNIIGKQAVFEMLKKANCECVLEYGIRIAIALKKVMIGNYGDNFNACVLLNISDDIVQNVLSYRHLHLFDMEKIDKCLIDFVVFVIKKMGKTNVENYVNDNDNLIRILMSILLIYAKDLKTSIAIFEEVGIYIVNFIDAQKGKEKTNLDDVDIETLSIFLKILIEIADPTLEMNQDKTSENLMNNLRENIANLRNLFPPQFHNYLDKFSNLLTKNNVNNNKLD